MLAASAVHGSNDLSDAEKAGLNKQKINALNRNLSNQTKPIERSLNGPPEGYDKKCLNPSEFYFQSPEAGLASFRHCVKLMQYMTKTRNTAIYLAYVSQSVSSPMSYFGHSFLIFNNNNSPFSSTLGYSAIIPENISYRELLVRGATGGLRGRLSFNPLHSVLSQYSSVEQRNVFLYKLNLTEMENVLLRMQAFELYNETFKYSFFFQNCSSELLQLLSSVHPNLLSKFNKNTLLKPTRVIEILKKDRLILDPAIIVYSDIEKAFVARHSLTKNGDNLSDRDAYILDKKADIYLNYFNKPLENHRDIKSKSFSYNQEIKIVSRPPISEIPTSTASIGYQWVEEDEVINLTYAVYSLDNISTRFSYVYETSLKILGFSLSFEKDDVSLNQLDLIELESLNKVFDGIYIPSWKFYVGYSKQSRNYGTPKNIMEISYGYSTGGLNTILAFLPQIHINLDDDEYSLQYVIESRFWGRHGNVTLQHYADFISTDKLGSKITEVVLATRLKNNFQFFMNISSRDSIKFSFMKRF